jgi:hypothetical protein
MNTLSEYFKTSSAYWGERSEWLVVAAVHREAGCLSRSNYRCLVAQLAGDNFKLAGSKGSQTLTDDVAIEEASHWAAGWIQYLVINPANTELVAKAEKLLERIEDYPVLDESDFSELETEEADQVWKNCYRPNDRIAYIRENRRDFEFRSLADMLSCVRGDYFAGYASELLN